MKSAVGILKNAEKDVLGVAKNIRTVLGAAFVISGGLGLTKLLGAVKELAAAGDELGDLEAGFQALGGANGVITKASASASGLIANVDLLKAATQGLARQIPNLNENFATMSEYAAKFAQATGKNATETLDALTAALARGKPALLNKLGLTIDQSAAYREMAGSLGITIDSEGKWESQLTKSSKTLAIQNAALTELKKKKEELPPIVIGVADAFEILSHTWTESLASAGKAIDNSTDLKTAVLELKDVLVRTDWEQAGKNFAALVGNILILTEKVVPLINMFVAGMEALSNTLNGKLENPITAKYKKVFEEGQAAIKKRKLDALFAPFNEDLAAANLQRKKDYEARLQQEAKLGQIRKDSAKKSAEQAAKAADVWSKTQNDFAKQSLGRQIKEAIESGDMSGFETLRAQLEKTTYDGILAGISNINKPGGPSQAQAEQLASAKAKFESDAYVSEMTEAEGKRGEERDKQIQEELQKQKKAFEESVSFFSDLFTEAIDTGTIDLGKRLKEIAIEFAANLAAGLTGISLDPRNIGASLAQTVLGGSGGLGGLIKGPMAGAGIASGIGDLVTGIGGFASGFSGAAVGPVASGAEYAGLMSGANAAAFLSNPVTIAAAAALAVGVIGQKQGWFGNHKPQNPDTKARSKVEGFLEDKTGRNFTFGDVGRFNGGKGFEIFKGMDKGNVALFSSLGEGLKDTLGIAEDIGPQIGAILAENLNGNIDKAKGLFAELGISADDMIQSITQAGVKAGKTWLEIEGQLQQVDRLAKPGLDAFGDIQGAYQGLLDSGAKGLDATNKLVAIAIEAQEKKFKTLQQLKDELKKNNNPAEVDKLFAALDQRGIKTLEAMATMSLRTSGAVVADMQAMGVVFKEVADAISGATDALTGFNTALSTTTIPSGTDIPKFATGGIVRRPTLGILGEAGPEAVIPLSRFNSVGRGGMGGGMNLYIDARGSQAGVSQEIHSVIQQYIPSIVNRSVGQMYDIARRGGASML